MLDLDSLRRSEDVRDDFNEYINAVLLQATEHDELMHQIKDERDGDSVLPEYVIGNVQRNLPYASVFPSEHFERLKGSIKEAAEITLKFKASERTSKGWFLDNFQSLEQIRRDKDNAYRALGRASGQELIGIR
jgi:hypothetical protein